MLGAIFLNGPGAGLYALLFVSTTHTADDSQRFLRLAAIDGAADVQLAEVALMRAGRSDVKALAQRIKSDHEQANELLKSLAAQRGAAISSETDNKRKRATQRMARLHGEEFDRAYVNAMVKDHKHDIKEFEKEARDGKDPELKAFAAHTLLVTRQRLEQAQQIRVAQQGQNDTQAKK